MGSWEYRSERLPLDTLAVWRGGRSVAIRSLRFAYFNFPEKNTKVSARGEAWATIAPAITDHLTTLAKDGWEPTTPISVDAVEFYEGEYVPTGLIVLAGCTVVLLPVIFILAYSVPNDYLAPRGMSVTLRRWRP